MYCRGFLTLAHSKRLAWTSTCVLLRLLEYLGRAFRGH